VVLARAALDEVAGQRERRAGEADERRGAELADERADRLGDVRDVVRRELGSRSRSAAVRNGCATTGPVPGTMSRSTPTALSGTTMSEKKMAASTP
jgi:hypothetical protein